MASVSAATTAVVATGFESAAEIWYDSDATVYENRQNCLMEQCKQLEVNLDNEIK